MVSQMGIEKYNGECRSIVMTYSAEWRHTIERLGRWIDFDHDYKVSDNHLHPGLNCIGVSPDALDKVDGPQLHGVLLVGV